MDENQKIADIFALVASYYVLEQDTFKANAFTKASNLIGNYHEAITSGPQARKIFKGKGIGDSTSAAIDEILLTGSLQRLTNFENKYKERSESVNLFQTIYGIGPVSAINFYDEGHRTLQDLWFKAKLNDAQKLGIIWRLHINLRIERKEMDIINDNLGLFLDSLEVKWAIAGSYRREETSSGDIDLLIENNGMVDMQQVAKVLSPILPAIFAIGPTKLMGMIRLSDKYNGHRIDIRLIDSESYAAALLYFTGSKNFNKLIRQRAIEFGMKLNEYGLYQDDNMLEINSEEDIFEALEVEYIAPKDRTKMITKI